MRSLERIGSTTQSGHQTNQHHGKNPENITEQVCLISPSLDAAGAGGKFGTYGAGRSTLAVRRLLFLRRRPGWGDRGVVFHPGGEALGKGDWNTV
jgi:hypothetical protein